MRIKVTKAGNYKVTLSEDEASDLATVCSYLGGTAVDTARETTNALARMFYFHGVNDKPWRLKGITFSP